MLLLLLISLSGMTSLERIEFLTETTVVMKTKRQIANAFILFEAFGLIVSWSWGWHHWREHAWSSRFVVLCIFHFLVERMMQQLILNKLKVAVRTWSPTNIIRAVSWEGVVNKVTLKFVGPHHMIHLIVYHILLLMLLQCRTCLWPLEGIEFACPINRYFSRKSIVGRSVKDQILDWWEKPIL